MSLHLVATPIGNPQDITFRAVEILKNADIVIGEERRELSTLLKKLGIENKRMEFLNEHSTQDDVKVLLDLCRDLSVALVTDCGTPGFCDPGARLVTACRKAGIQIRTLPGASSLMCLLSIAGENWNQFVFRGFLPAEREERGLAIQELKRERRAVVIMDTPYRLVKLLQELAQEMPDREAVLGCDFTLETESVYEGRLADLPSQVGERKSEFVLALKPVAGTGIRVEKAERKDAARAPAPPSRSSGPGPRPPHRGGPPPRRK